jgi:cobyrinic acid a,c-diamide synthase
MMGDENILKSLQTFSADADLAVIEGNQGLFDGLDPEGHDSTAGLAHLIEAPVIFVVDASRMNRGIAAMLSGFINFDPTLTIAGIILNKVGGARHEAKLVEAIERHLTVPVLGKIPKMYEEVGVTERHLGLVPIKEDPALPPVIDIMADAIEKFVDIDRLIAIAATAGELPCVPPCHLTTGPGDVTVAVARDRAFTFYYPENLEALEAAGATLLPFSPLTDPALPAGIDGIYIGGGFPEMFMERLGANESLREEIRRRGEEGLPIYAECGGLMYLTRSIRWNDRSAPMAGLIDCDTVMTKKPMGLGYMKLEPTGACGWLSGTAPVNCHEFHHSRMEGLSADDPSTRYAWKVVRGAGVVKGFDGIVYKNVLASYAHLHHCGAPHWANDYVTLCRVARSHR